MKLMSTIGAVLLTMTALNAKDLSVLMIGNSFSLPLTRHLDKIVKSVPGNSLYLASCYIGGCTLDRHAENIDKAQENPDFKPYRIDTRDTSSSAPEPEYYDNVISMLKKRKWDVVTIQQGSHESWDYKFYQPHADKLIAIIRKFAPQAEIVIQQTWSYRCDDPRLISGTPQSWGFDQNGMYERLASAYSKLAEAHKLRVIPTGLAVQIFRRDTPVKFKPATQEELAALAPGEVPGSAGDVAGAAWRDKEGALKFDHIHLNRAGDYMQNCLWFGFLYGISPLEIKYKPADMPENEAAFLRRCAAEALTEYQCK